MLQARRRRDLLHEPLGAEHGGELRLQYFQRDLAFVLEILGKKHRRHAAGAELALDLVSAGERDVEAIRDRRHLFAACARSSAAQLGMTTISSLLAATGRSMRNDLPSGDTSNGAWPAFPE